MDRLFKSLDCETELPNGQAFGLGSKGKVERANEPARARQTPPVVASHFSASQLLAGFTVGRSEHEYHANRTVFLQGEPANAVFYIESGEVKLSVVSRNGKQAIVDILGESAFFGEGCLAGEPVRVATAVTLQRSKIIRLEKRVLLDLFQRVPSIAEEFITQIASRNLRMQADLADHIFNSSEKRLARLLFNLAREAKHPGRHGVIPRISQETLAEMVGTTRSRVSFFLNRFRECGFITYNRTAIQVNPSLLSVLSHDNVTRP
jgi:CRP/FNR family transcriptional regulator, cyclic AMP receptor protein